MIQASINRLEHLCNTISDLLQDIPETDFVYKPSPDIWSKKEILGHLIDSAANNHQRFVRGQFEQLPTIVYDQDNWVNLSNYNLMNTYSLITMWSTYNRFIIELLKNISPDNLQRKCQVGGKSERTIEWLLNDYALHLEHHLKQFVAY